MSTLHAEKNKEILDRMINGESFTIVGKNYALAGDDRYFCVYEKYRGDHVGYYDMVYVGPSLGEFDVLMVEDEDGRITAHPEDTNKEKLEEVVANWIPLPVIADMLGADRNWKDYDRHTFIEVMASLEGAVEKASFNDIVVK